MTATVTPQEPNRPRLFLLAAVALLVLLLAWVAWRTYQARQTAGQIFGSGSIEATQVNIGPKIAGRVIRMTVNEGDRVTAGQVVAELEPQESAAQVAQALAQVRQAQAKLAQARQAIAAQEQVTSAQVAQAQAQVTSAATGVPQSEAQLAISERTAQEAVRNAQAQLSAAEAQVAAALSALGKAQDDLSRIRALFAQGAVSAQDVDAAQTAYDAAVAQDRTARDAVTQAQASLATAEANLLQIEVRRQAVIAARAAVTQAQAGLLNARSGYTVVQQRREDLAAAEAALAQAQANLEYQQVLAAHNVITSPLTAIVQTKYVQQGEVVAAGTPLYTVIDLRDIWLRTFIPEEQIGQVKVGQTARVTVDSFSGRVFHGRVIEVSSRGEFTPGNVQTRGDRVTLVFSVKIQLDNSDNSLKPGVPADAEILVDAQGDRTRR